MNKKNILLYFILAKIYKTSHLECKVWKLYKNIQHIKVYDYKAKKKKNKGTSGTSGR